jgi:dTDP-4-amino-4,6-dideoxygalactose transaminase
MTRPAIPLFKVAMSEAAPKMVAEVLRSGYVGQGQRVEDFETALRAYFNWSQINTLNSATSGLELAVRMTQRVSSGEILTTPLTCTATNFAILAAGLRLRWVDVNPTTGNMDLADLEIKIGPKAQAVMVVHWGGYPCDLDRLLALQMNYLSQYARFVPIIEDCAHAWGAKYKGKLLGTHGNPSIFSFQAIKHLTTGDGGCIISPNEAHYRRAKLLRWYGLDRESSADFRCSQDVKEWGFKFHMNDIAAAIGIANLMSVSERVNAHKANGRYYYTHLEGVPGLTLMEDLPDRESSFWVFTLRVERREDFVRKMAEKGIAVSQVHARNDKHSCLKEFRCHLPGMDVLEKEMICIPCGWWLTPEDLEYIVANIKGGW